VNGNSAVGDIVMRALKPLPGSFTVGRGYWIDDVLLKSAHNSFVAGSAVFWDKIGIEITLNVVPNSSDLIVLTSDYLTEFADDGPVLLLAADFGSLGGIVLGNFCKNGTICEISLVRTPIDRSDRIIVPLA